MATRAPDGANNDSNNNDNYNLPQLVADWHFLTVTRHFLLLHDQRILENTSWQLGSAEVTFRLFETEQSLLYYLTRNLVERKEE